MPAGREGVERRAGDVVRDGDDRNGNALVEAESPGWNRGSVEDDRRRAGAGGILDRGDRIVARADEGGAAGDHAQSVSVEEGVQRRRGKKSARARTGAPFLRPRKRELPGMRRQHGPGEGQQPVDQHVEGDADDDPYLLRVRAQVGGPDAESRR